MALAQFTEAANTDRVAAAEAAFRAAAQRRGFTSASINADLAELDHMATAFRAAFKFAASCHRALDYGRMVRRGLREVTGAFDADFIAESMREAMDLSPEAHAVLAARMSEAA